MDDDEEYWNSSEVKAFNFDDDVLSPQEILAIGQISKPFSGVGGESSILNNISNAKAPQIPLSSLISSKVLDTIILAQSGKDPVKDARREQEESISVTLKRLVLGRSHNIHVHRSLKSKTELLDGAIAIGDGNVILTVVLYLIQTLNKKLVYELFSARSVALNHYISFLQNEGKITELSDMLTMLGRSPEAAMFQFQHHVKSQDNNIDGLIKKMSNVMANHFSQPGIDSHQAKMVSDYVKLLEWQKHVNNTGLTNKSALYCLAYCCTHNWNDTAGNVMSPLTICQRQQISPLQYDWVALNVHANAGKWDYVDSLFTKKDWLGRTTVSTHIPIEVLISRLHQLKASQQMLATYTNKIQDTDERLRIAQMYKIHPVIIETYVKLKDRLALTNYKMTLNPQSEEYILAENTLRTTAIKWKN